MSVLRRSATTLLFVALLLAALSVSAAPTRIEVSVTEPAALFDIVERMSNWRTPGGALDETYVRYWREAVGWTAADDEAVFAYRRLRRSHRDSGSRPSLVEEFQGLDMPFPVVTSAARHEDDLALAFLAADDWDALWPQLESRFGGEDTARLKAIFAHVRERFGKVIRRALFLHAYAARARVVLSRPEAASLLDRLPALFGVKPKDVPVFRVRLAWLPPRTEQTRATMLGAYAVMEIREDIGLRHLLDVAVHEFSHRLHEQMPIAARRRLARAFLTAPDAVGSDSVGMAAANVLFESLATTLGQGIFAQRLFAGDYDEKRAWYEDRGYDTTAKATKPLVTAYLDGGRLLDEAFAHAYVAAYAKARGEETRRDLLRRAIVVTPDERTERRVVGHLMRVVRPRVVMRYRGDDRSGLDEALATFPAMTVLAVGARLGEVGQRFVLRFDDAEAFEAAWPAPRTR